MPNGRRTLTLADSRDGLAALKPGKPLEVLGREHLRTPRLVLRPFRAADRDEFIRVVRESRDHLAEFSPLHMPGESDGELFARQLRLALEGDSTLNACRRAAFDESGRLVCAINLNSIRRGLTFEADANWWTGADALHRGYATEALGALLLHAFTDLPAGLGLHRVLAGIQPQNTASRRLAERLGFRRLGPERSYLHAGGKWDLHEMYEVSPDTLMLRAAGGERSALMPWCLMP
ncbi:MAG TPA: GNAT family protein [Phycisphaerales bacterium]|nr:GNAT family protein [Phycisphaerales bacterium]